MLKRIARSQTPWTCSRCLRAQRQNRYLNTLAAATTTSSQEAVLPSPTPSSLRGLAPDYKHDDRTLRQIFDSPKFWEEFSQESKRHATKSAGLFRNGYLTTPEGFTRFAQHTVQKCEKIVDSVVAASTVDEYKKLARDLDRLSDLLCRVIDLSDFVRGTHPDRRIQIAATKAYTMMFEYMNKLNTTTELHDQLQKAAVIPEVQASWSEQEMTVAKILIEDFSRSAIELPEGARQKFVELSSVIAHVGNEFVETMEPEKAYLTFDSSRVRGLDPNLARAMTRWGKVTIPTMDTPAQLALRSVEDPDVRREIYMAVRTSSKASIQRLETMLKARAELAKLSGYKSFAHMTLENKMAQSPEAVNQFLGALVEDNHRQVQDELQELLELKKADARSDNFPGRINAWDKFYYTHKLVQSMNHKIRSPDFLSAYFSLGTVMQGLSRLFNSLYGLRLVPREPAPGETWNDDVRRLDVVSDSDGHVAVLYCDLFSRPGKTPNPAHFTLRCSREISTAEVEEAANSPNPTPFSTPIEAATDGMAVSFNPHTNTHFQLPTIALVCDFARPPSWGSKSQPTLLTFNDVRTLFHEMGHAVHSFLGRTALQNVSGTRCATDFAELPSVLMEHFAACPEVLSLYARHWETDAPLPISLVEQRLEIDTRTQPAETEAQILLAMLDQEYHSSLPLQSGFKSTKTYHEIFTTHASIPEPQGTAWQGFFGHLFGYGATYYSYLFDRAIAGKIWRDVFQRTKDGSIRRENGEKYKEEVLKWGGGRSGWKCVAGVLGDARLADGGEMAMKEVGRWGVR